MFDELSCRRQHFNLHQPVNHSIGFSTLYQNTKVENWIKIFARMVYVNLLLSTVPPNTWPGLSISRQMVNAPGALLVSSIITLQSIVLRFVFIESTVVYMVFWNLRCVVLRNLKLNVDSQFRVIND